VQLVGFNKYSCTYLLQRSFSIFHLFFVTTDQFGPWMPHLYSSTNSCIALFSSSPLSPQFVSWRCHWPLWNQWISGTYIKYIAHSQTYFFLLGLLIFFHLAEIVSVNTISLNKSTVVTCAAYARTQVEINVLTALTWTNTNLTKSVVHTRKVATMTMTAVIDSAVEAAKQIKSQNA